MKSDALDADDADDAGGEDSMWRRGKLMVERISQ